MGKFSSKAAPANVHAPLSTTGTRIPTHEGGVGYARDAKSDLFLLAVSNLVGEKTFYEDGQVRDRRFEDLIHQVTREDPDWVARFVPFLRNVMHMRSASIVMACEYVKAGGTNGRKVIDAAMSRADEPAEVLAYWMQRHGRTIPAAVKRGVADAVGRLYTENAALKYDGKAKAWRMGDVIELIHPKPANLHDSALYRYLLDARHHPENVPLDRTALSTITLHRVMETVPVAERKGYLDSADPDTLRRAGMTWERLSGWLQGPMDAAAWSKMIPSMGYMALLRNLRNFDQTGVSDAVAERVAKKLSDPNEVARSRQFPIRFYSAWRHTGTMRWGQALEKALNLSLANVPSLPGRTLIMVDTSSSMTWAGVSERSTVRLCDLAALFGISLAVRAEKADVVAYDHGSRGIAVDKGESVLRVLERFPFQGGGTYTWEAFHRHYQGHDRVIILSDEQAMHDWSRVPSLRECPADIITFNIGGYGRSHHEAGERGRYLIGGMTDAAFTLVDILSRWGKDTGWPF